MKCPQCKSSNIERTYIDSNDSFFDEYECKDCGLGLDLFEDEFIIAASQRNFNSMK